MQIALSLDQLQGKLWQESELRQHVLGMVGVDHSRNMDERKVTGHGDQLWEVRKRVRA